MAHLQYMPGDPRLVDQLVCELKSKGIFDQFRKDCIADVDTRPAYQNLRQRVESSVASFLARQCWQPDLNKNQLREKLRKHILDGNYLEQGVERIVDQVVNPKVSSVFIPQVEDLVYNYLGITRKKSTPKAETSNGQVEKEDLLPTDLEAVSPGSVKSTNGKDDLMDVEEISVDDELKEEPKGESIQDIEKDKECVDTQMSGVSDLTEHDSDVVVEKSAIPLPEEMKLKDIPLPVSSPPTADSQKIDVDKIKLPTEFNLAAIPMPKEDVKEQPFKSLAMHSDDDDSSSDSSIIRNMSPLTPIRNYNNENSCDAHQGFDDSNDVKNTDTNDPSSFRFTIENKSSETSPDIKTEEEKKDPEKASLSYQFNNQVNINAPNSFNTPTFEDSSNSHNLQIDYESDANSKLQEVKLEEKVVEEVKKEVKSEERKSSHKSSHRSRDASRHSSSSKDRSSRRSDSKASKDKDSKDRKASKDESSKKSSHRERSKDRSDKKENRDSSKNSSHKSLNHKDSKSHRSSSSSQHRSSKSDDKKSSSSSSSRDKSSRSDRSSDKSSKDSRSSKDSKSQRSDRDKDRKSSSSSKSKNDDKDKEKKEKKDADDHYRLSGRGSNSRRSTDRDSNDGSSSSKGSHNQTNSKTTDSKRSNKSSNKSENASSSDNTSPSDKEIALNEAKGDANLQTKPIVRVDTHLEVPIANPPRLPFVPDVTIKKPKFAANMKEAKQLMKMRKFLDDEQKRMNQEAALLLEFQANVRPNLSQVYSSIPGPELEFACVNNSEDADDTKSVDKKEDLIAEQLQESIENIHNHIMETDNSDVMNTSDESDSKVNKFEAQNTESLQEMLSQGNNEESKNESAIIHPEKTTEMLPDKIVYEPKISEEVTQNEVKPEILEEVAQEFEITIITEEVSDLEDSKNNDIIEVNKTIDAFTHPEEKVLKFFTEQEKYSAEVKKGEYNTFLKNYSGAMTNYKKMYVLNCDSYKESTIKEASKEFGEFEIVNYLRNGHLKINKNIVKDLNISTEVTLPLDAEDRQSNLIFSPVKSECSFELTNDYEVKLEEMVNRASRKEIMEIILGGQEPSESETIQMPKLDYTMDFNIESNDCSLKRKINESDCIENNNQQVLTPNKIRKLSCSDQISSTTEETDQPETAKTTKVMRSKYLGKAKRVGLPRPKKTNLPNSPSSDMSVENYEQNTPTTPNRKLKQRNKVQRYDTSDLYKPKLHFLSRRNNIHNISSEH